MKSRAAFVLACLVFGACAPKLLDLPSDGGTGGSSGSGSSSGSGGSSGSVPHGGASALRPQPTPTKLDLLFMIDNSSSMGDKQAYLETAIPDLINRLVAPNCIDASGNTQGASTNDGECPSGQTVEFPPVHDMHIGIVSSSLGPRLGDQNPASPVPGQPGAGAVCLASATVTYSGTAYPAHNDDQAHLLNRATTPATFPATTPLPDAPNGFLAWFPTVTENTGKPGPTGAPSVTDVNGLESDFTDLVAGAEWFGCGIESQLESWYRFLIQPDPYATLTLNDNLAQWVGVDTTILQQRKDFLRPDSLVGIIDLTDEDDSEIDVRSLGGHGYLFMSTAFDPPCASSACATNPADPSCVSCQEGSSDPACSGTNCPYTNEDDWGYDPNLRHVHMKAKYGLDAQFPINRYVNGLTSLTVPDRTGEYPTGATSYQGNNDCVNPLFAGALADPTTLSSSIATTVSAADATTLCALPAGVRSSANVFFAIIGGVPHQLLHYDPTSAANSELSAADWVKILGTDPDNYDYSGIDPHMIESQTPRSGLAAPTAPDGTDPISGREWITNTGAHADLNVDLEYACIFPLATPRDCTNPDNELACDCSTAPGVLTASQTSPVCDPTTVTQQDYGKAYPTIRELDLARHLGSQGIAASLCPIDVADNATGNDPLYGYRPAADEIVRHWKTQLAPN